MADSKKNTIVVMCSIVGCIMTLLTCGVLIGNIQANDQTQTEQITKTADKVEAIYADVSSIKEEQAFQKGVVSTQLGVHGTALVRIEKKLDDLAKVD